MVPLLARFGQLPHNELLWVTQSLGYAFHDSIVHRKGEKISLSRRVEKHWRLIGWDKSRQV
ncbi:putative translation elongation factor EF1A/initiation factor IF2gamma [Helianthus annuus]|nr:putative translation elongation factor EF1A/initiation factor IF2gamma [Helianthus annuus]